MAFGSAAGAAAYVGPKRNLNIIFANELGSLGDVVGEITETLLRARIKGKLGAPKINIEVLRHGLP